MTNNRHRAIAAGLIAACLSIAANAAEGRWTAGFGQGNFEYFIDAQGVTLRIGCPTKDGSADMSSSLALENTTSGKPIPKFTIKVNGIVYQGPFETGSRAGDENFISLLNGLRKTDAVVTYGSKSVTFPKSNGAAVLPQWGTKKFVCNMS